MEKEVKNDVSKGLIDKVKTSFMDNKLVVILGICNIIPMIICLTFWPANVLLSLFIVPVLYRFICSFILSTTSKKGRPQNVTLFTIISRASIFIGFFLLSIVAIIIGKNESSFIEIIILCVCLAFFDKILILLLKILFQVVFKTSLPISGSNGSNVQSVDALLDNTKSSFTRPDGDVVYQDANGMTIGMSSSNPDGSTSYYNRDMKFIGTSNNTNGVERYYDKDLSYKGQSEKDAHGDTVFHDEKLNFKGKFSKNSNGTSSYHKK